MPESPPYSRAKCERLVPGQADRHARLQDAIASDDAPLRFIVNRAVQRVRHGPDELPRGIARQLGIRVQGNDVLHAGQHRSIADNQ